MRSGLAVLILFVGGLGGKAAEVPARKPIEVKVSFVEVDSLRYRALQTDAGSPADLRQTRSIFVAAPRNSGEFEDGHFGAVQPSVFLEVIPTADLEQTWKRLRQLEDREVLTVDVLPRRILPYGKSGQWMLVAQGERAATVTLLAGRTKKGKIVVEVEMEVARRRPDLLEGQVIAGRATARARSCVLLAPGETIVVGGFEEHGVAGKVVKVPLLGEVPWLGDYFTWRTFEDKFINTCVLITAR
ncbi:MAG: hypothetical protein AB7K24_11075 [Gemmataceae bacterium]